LFIESINSIAFIFIGIFLSFYAIKSYIEYVKEGNLKHDKTLYWGMGFVALSLAFIIRVAYTLYPSLCIEKIFMYENLLVGLSTWLHAYAIMLVSYKYKEFTKTKLSIVYWLLLIIVIPLMTIVFTKPLCASILNISMIGLILYTLDKVRMKHFLFNGFLLMIIARILYLIRTVGQVGGHINEIYLGMMTVGIITIGFSSYKIIKDRRKLDE